MLLSSQLRLLQASVATLRSITTGAPPAREALRASRPASGAPLTLRAKICERPTKPLASSIRPRVSRGSRCVSRSNARVAPVGAGRLAFEVRTVIDIKLSTIDATDARRTSQLPGGDAQLPEAELEIARNRPMASCRVSPESVASRIVLQCRLGNTVVADAAPVESMPSRLAFSMISTAGLHSEVTR